MEQSSNKDRQEENKPVQQQEKPKVNEKALSESIKEKKNINSNQTVYKDGKGNNP